eukprot:TRINITY_DN7412_c0_g1_i6.p1 TRINITY_DN7412_c0_g1~~TRINITY_DN7412_c0_g1_i6.p1  ORF type:complete len:465 (+),score=116.32 TRINITY_DN7412_c0_g1_i6:50-1444(+)
MCVFRFFVVFWFFFFFFKQKTAYEMLRSLVGSEMCIRDSFKLVSCTKGRLFDVVVDLRIGSPTYKKYASCLLSGDTMNAVLVPPGVGHAFVALEASSTMYVQGGEFNPASECDVNLFDPDIGIVWPIEQGQMVISAKDKAAPPLSSDKVQRGLAVNWQRPCDVLLMGSSGYFGSHYEKHLRAKGLDYVVVPCRLHQRQEICIWLDRCSPKAVICTAGTAGKPNISWCDTHPAETMDMNVTSQINLAHDCKAREIHCTLMVTGMLYDPSLSPEGHVFTEQDPPNIHMVAAKPAPVYCQLRILEEQMLTMGNYLDQEQGNVLALRYLLPVSDDLHERSTLMKLTKYPKLFSMPATWTVLDDLVPVSIDLALKKVVGIFNWSNPGQMTHHELMNLYKIHVDPDATWECATIEEMANARTNAPLSMEKLFSVYPEARELVPDVKQSVERMLISAAEKRALLAKSVHTQ